MKLGETKKKTNEYNKIDGEIQMFLRDNRNEYLRYADVHGDEARHGPQ